MSEHKTAEVIHGGVVTGVLLHRNAPTNTLDVWMTVGSLRVRAIVVDPAPPDPGQIVPPSFSLDKNGAQNLMDELWFAGVRPTGEDSKASKELGAELKAQTKHLEDMRTLVFTFMDLKN